MDYERRVLTGAGLIAAGLITVLGLAMVALATTIAAQDRLDAAFARQVLLAQDLRGEKMRQNALVPAYVLDGEPAVLDQLHAADTAFNHLAARLLSEPLSAQARTRLASAVAHEAVLQAVERGGVTRRQGGAPVEAVDAWFREQARTHSRAIAADLDAFVRLTTDHYRAAQKRAQNVSKTIFVILAATCLATLLFSAILSGLILRLTRQKRELDQARERLARQDRQMALARKDAVETVAHDLRSPLTAIVIASDLLRNGANAASVPQKPLLLEAITASAQSMNRLISDVLDHAKIEAGVFTVHRTPVDLGPLIETIVTRFDLIATRKQVALVRRSPPSFRLVNADVGRVEQLLSNLISNAIKFTPPDGEVVVDAREDGEDLLLTVTDTGPGLEPAHLERLFERYWQDARTAAQGTGLGLCIAKAVVDSHHGRLEVESRPSCGATFNVRLPLAPPLQASLT